MACYNSSNSVNFIKQKKSKLNKYMPYQFSSVQFLSRVRLCDPMNRSTPGLPVHHQLLEFTQISILNNFFSPKSNKCWKVCQALMCMPGPASSGPRLQSESGQQVSKDGRCTNCSLTFVKPLKIFLIKKTFFSPRYRNEI